MEMIKENKDNGCIIQYSESPIKLPNSQDVFFKIDYIHKPERAADDDMAAYLKEIENQINWELINKRGLTGVFPHFYIQCPYTKEMALVLETFIMSYVDDLNIMLYPADNQLKFQGTWDEYKAYLNGHRRNALVVNATDTEDDGSMIQYWINSTHYAFHHQDYVCPATQATLGRNGLDGAHVEIVGHSEFGQFIIPIQKGFNRGHSKQPFFVNPDYLVVAP